MGHYANREIKPATVQRSTHTPNPPAQAVPQADHRLHDLQRLLGNQGVQRMLAANPTIAQAKLTVGAADDAYEQEADRVASEVMSTPSPTGDSGVQREAAPEDDELAMKRHPDIVQRAALGEEDEMGAMKRIQRASDEQDMMGSFDVEGQLESQIQGEKGGGQNMDSGDRQFMESRFGQDFSDVKVHTGGQSDAINRSIGARAFTNGSDVFLRGGEYNPGTSAGRELLAHELTHVVQQTGSKPLQPKRDETCDGC